jgi:hypothetical protein
VREAGAAQPLCKLLPAALRRLAVQLQRASQSHSAICSLHDNLRERESEPQERRAVGTRRIHDGQTHWQAAPGRRSLKVIANHADRPAWPCGTLRRERYSLALIQATSTRTVRGARCLPLTVS